MTIAFNEDAGVVLAADLGATHARLAVTNLAVRCSPRRPRTSTIADGPETVLDWVDERFHDLLRRDRPHDDDVRGIGIGVPGPVEHATGRPRNPPIMPGWDGYPIPERFADRYDVPVLVDNDVNIMALGEHWTQWRQVEHLLFVKVATGIGCGIVVEGASIAAPRERPATSATSALRVAPRKRSLQLWQRRLPRGSGRRQGDGLPAARTGLRGRRHARRGRARARRRGGRGGLVRDSAG